MLRTAVHRPRSRAKSLLRGAYEVQNAVIMLAIHADRPREGRGWRAMPWVNDMGREQTVLVDSM